MASIRKLDAVAHPSTTCSLKSSRYFGAEVNNAKLASMDAQAVHKDHADTGKGRADSAKAILAHGDSDSGRPHMHLN